METRVSAAFRTARLTEAMDDLGHGLVGEPALGKAGVDQGQRALVIAARRSRYWEPLLVGAILCAAESVSPLVADLPRASIQIARRASPRKGDPVWRGISARGISHQLLIAQARGFQSAAPEPRGDTGSATPHHVSPRRGLSRYLGDDSP